MLSFRPTFSLSSFILIKRLFSSLDCTTLWNIVKTTESNTLKMVTSRDFPGGPAVKTLPSSTGGIGLILGGELRFYMLHGQKAKIYFLKKQCCDKFNRLLKWSVFKKNLKKKWCHLWYVNHISKNNYKNLAKCKIISLQLIKINGKKKSG